MNYSCSYCGANICSDKECINCGAKAPNPLKVDNLIQLLVTRASKHPSISRSIEFCLSKAKEAANDGKFAVMMTIESKLSDDQQYFLRDHLKKLGFRTMVCGKLVKLEWGPPLLEPL